MKEQLIALAKEKGFISEFMYPLPYRYSNKEEMRYYLYLCEIQKWLRDTHQLYITMEETSTFALITGIGFYSSVIKVDNVTKELETLKCHMYFCSTYEEAVEEGVIECLKLLNHES